MCGRGVKSASENNLGDRMKLLEITECVKDKATKGPRVCKENLSTWRWITVTESLRMVTKWK